MEIGCITPHGAGRSSHYPTFTWHVLGVYSIRLYADTNEGVVTVASYAEAWVATADEVAGRRYVPLFFALGFFCAGRGEGNLWT